LEEVKKEEQTTIETLFDRSSLGDEVMTTYQKAYRAAQKAHE